MNATCPVCGSTGVLTGDTEMYGEDELSFHADSFTCSACELTLDDSIEIELVGMESAHDRSNELHEYNIESNDEYRNEYAPPYPNDPDDMLDDF